MARLNKDMVFPLIKGVLDGELTRAEFDELTNLKPGGYEYWLRKYRNASICKGDFVKVKSGSSKKVDSEVEVILAGGVRIRFANLVTAQYLRELVSTK